MWIISCVNVTFVKRDSTKIGEVTVPPYFWGPFESFQTIETSGFDSDHWIKHSKNIYEDLSNKKVNQNLIIRLLKRIVKIIIGRDFVGPLPHKIIKMIESGSKTLDIGGGWGDNYYSLLCNGITPKKGRYFVLDNQRQAEFGKTIFNSSDVNFLTDIPSDEFELILLIGTLQYIENWKSVFETFQNLNSKIVYIARTPFVRNCDSFCAVQSITPSTINFKIGEENLNIISFEEFRSLCKIFKWKIHQVGSETNYSTNFSRLPSEYRDVFYQPLILSKM